MNFSYGVIAAVGVLVAISLGLIAVSPDDIIQPRMVSDEEGAIACTLQWDPMCGVDGKTYGNLCMLDAANVKLDHKGECVDMLPTETLPMTLTISIPKGSGVLGCENTNECFLPYEVSVAAGATVTWNNDDTAAHTVTSGTISSADGLFDSKLFGPDISFEFTFNDVGTYDYFCMVHPWMTGIVNVL